MAYLTKLTSSALRMAYSCHLRSYSASHPLIYSKEVFEAKKEGKPIVALESTIITHGMPYPQNLETAVQVEDIIRQQGAVPATIAILKGQITVGLSNDQLQYLAQAKGVVKASRRDLPPIVAGKLDGATTVAGTIIVTQLAEIPIFVTGGIGGVHREGENTLDISADLNELGRNNTLVVCSGVKSILDIGKTLEYLETQGVCVCAFGKSTEFPAFYTVNSGYQAPHHVLNAEHAARILHAAHTVQLQSGIVVAVPIPKKYAMDETVIENAIQSALNEANKKKIYGKNVTPYILASIAKVTDGSSLTANIALIKNNAKVGASIAIEFNKLKNVNNFGNAFNIEVPKGKRKCSPDLSRNFHTACNVRREETSVVTNDLRTSAAIPEKTAMNVEVLVIGGANIDRTYRVTEEFIQLDGSTHACVTEQCGGGVARNIAEALWRLRRGNIRLLTAIGDDADGQYLQDIAPGLLLDGCVVKGASTPTYAAVLDAVGECRLGLGDMTLHNHITIDLVKKHIDVLKQAKLIVLDGNPPQTTIDYVLQLCDSLHKPVFFEPTDRRKAVKVLQTRKPVKYASPNLLELRAMANYIKPYLKVKEDNTLNEILELAKIVSEFVDFLIVTVGSDGAYIIKYDQNKTLDNDSSESMFRVRFYPTEIIHTTQNVSGAGDCFTSGFIYGILLKINESCSVSVGFQMAKLALLSKNTIPSHLSVDIKKYTKYISII